MNELWIFLVHENQLRARIKWTLRHFICTLKMALKSRPCQIIFGPIYGIPLTLCPVYLLSFKNQQFVPVSAPFCGYKLLSIIFYITMDSLFTIWASNDDNAIVYALWMNLWLHLISWHYHHFQINTTKGQHIRVLSSTKGTAEETFVKIKYFHHHANSNYSSNNNSKNSCLWFDRYCCQKSHINAHWLHESKVIVANGKHWNICCRKKDWHIIHYQDSNVNFMLAPSANKPINVR